MTLRTKTFVTIAGTLAVLTAVLYGVAIEIVEVGFEKVEKASLAGFSKIEQNDAVRNVHRVTDAVNYRIENISTKAADWSMWDDSYQFVVDKNKDFVQSNLGDEALVALKLNLLLIMDASGNIVFGKGVDLENGKTTPIPEDLRQYLAKGGVLTTFKSEEDAVTGLVALPEGAMMLAARPIVKSSGEGPIRGAMIFGRYLDDAEFSQLSQITHLTIAKTYPKTEKPDGDFLAAIPELTDQNPIKVVARREDFINGYTSLTDLSGNPAMYLRVDVPREIYKQGLSTRDDIRDRGRVIITSLVISILLTGLIIAGVIGFSLEKWVLSRLARLSKKVVMIGGSGDFSARVEASGEDEIASLGMSVNKMLGDLETSHHAIEVRNAAMALVLDTIPTGLLSLDQDFSINPEHSKIAEVILGTTDLAGRPFVEVLGLVGEREEDGKGLVEFLDVMRQELVDEASMAGLNPFEELLIERNGESRWVKLNYYLIHRGEGNPNHILAVLTDITEKKRLAAKVARSERENVQLKNIAEDPELFREFLSESQAILKSVEAEVQNLMPSAESLPLVNDIFRGVHTIKGVSGSFGLMQLSEMAGELEEALEPLRRDADAITDSMIAQTKASLTQLMTCFNEAKESARSILGDDIDSGGGVVLRISSEEIGNSIKSLLALDLEGETHGQAVRDLKREMIRKLSSLREVAGKRGLARALKIVPGLIDRLGKCATFSFEGESETIDCDVARELNTPLIHLIRNALDHGIEDPDVRLDKGKPEEGKITLALEKKEGKLILALSDDGKGIDPEVMRKAAVKKGMMSAEEAGRLSDGEALLLIFKAGFSTADSVSDVSGRGVGMDAVMDSVKTKLGGEIKVESKVGEGTRFVLEVPLNYS